MSNAQAIARLLARVLVARTNAAEVLILIRTDDDPRSIEFAAAPDGLPFRIVADGDALTAVIGEPSSDDLLTALRSLLAAYVPEEDGPTS